MNQQTTIDGSNDLYCVHWMFRLSSFGVSPFSGSSQGMDIFEDKVLFQAGVYGDLIHVLDLETSSLKGTIGFIAPFNESSHMNNINCGEKYCDSDYYPLLYVSQTFNSHSCFVLRLSNILNSYELIQTIQYVGNLHHLDGDYDWFIDLKNRYIYTYGIHNGNIEEREILKFPLPGLDQPIAALGDEDVLDSFLLSDMSIYQGSRIIDGLLFAPVGSGDDKYPGYLKIFDLASKSLIENVPLNCGEPESIGPYKDGAIICGGGKNPNYYFIQL